MKEEKKKTFLNMTLETNGEFNLALGFAAEFKYNLGHKKDAYIIFI